MIGYKFVVSDQASCPIDKDARIAELEAALASRDTLITTLRFQLAQLRRMRFGQSSEKLSQQIEQLELTLEELEGEAAAVDAARSETSEVDRPAPIRQLPAHLPRAERRIEPEAGHCTCPDCGGSLRPLGEDSDEILDVAPVQWRVIRTVRPKYSCRACEKIVQAPAPVKAVARGKASFATLAHVVVNKFDHHLPLYRQAEIMAAQGIELDRSTLAGWAGQAASLLDPIVMRIREEGIKARKLHVDDTPVPMLVPGKGKTALARLWAYVVDDRPSGATTPALVWYRFTPDRSGIHPQTELKHFTGLLQADGYAGYDKLYEGGHVREVACWAHFRRKIFENHQTSPTPLTTDLLERIAGLYRIEDEIRGSPPEVRRRQRQERSGPRIEELRISIDDALRRLSPKSAMAKALAYGRKRWDALTRHAGNIRLAKLVERGITSFIYTYDFGDDWRHLIEIEGVFAADTELAYPRFVDGERRAPPEDVGGFPGFEEFVDAMAMPRHPNRKSMLEWYGRPFDPLDISADEINARMAKLAKRRALGKASHVHAKWVRR